MTIPHSPKRISFILPRLLHFKQPAGTSRGTYTTRRVWYVLLMEIESRRYGLGECAPLPDLSCDALPAEAYEALLWQACHTWEESGCIDPATLRPYPSILFGLESALQHLRAGNLRLWDTPFSRGEAGIPINGLIWMGTYEEMYRRIEEKMRLGFRCIKLKIGAIDFERELELLTHIRRRFPPQEVELRVDANGAFTPQEAPEKLRRLASLGLHSIEQPIRAGQWKEMARLCAGTPLPIALDEELIGINERRRKEELLDTIRPQYIILKPSLHGGISGSEEWIELARERGIGYWVTSALESNIGLNAIAQWCATLHPTLPQGLGTGLLFTDNVECPLHIEGDCLWFTSPSPSPSSYGGSSRKDSVAELTVFLHEWYSPSPTLPVHTSGSTGRPKELRVEKSRMAASARLTCSFLGLHEGDTALLCMPLSYIAGKMVVVRTLVAGLRLWPVTPSNHPLKGLQRAPDFAAMVPMQVYCSLQVAEERELLKQVSHLIIGGGAIAPPLEAELRHFPNAVWSTYGMTETLSHIALRRLNGPEASDRYIPLEEVKVRLSPEGTLVIHAPRVCPEELTTNDLAEIDEQGHFRILGRRDNAINSGGVKIQIEEVEATLRSHWTKPFLISSAPDEKFGEIVVLLAEGPLAPEEQTELETLCRTQLPPYQRPKLIISVPRLPLTESGKPDRARAKELCRTPDKVQKKP